MLVGVIASCAHIEVDTHAGRMNVHKENLDEICQNFGPQTPRNIYLRSGENTVVFPKAPSVASMNLCNIHFHNAAEHKAKAFSISTAKDENRQSSGYQCGISTTLTPAELTPYEGNKCSGIEPGDTIEVHWVYSTCDVSPGPGLGSCLSETCANPSLRVETQVFTVVNDLSALNFSNYSIIEKSATGFNQSKALPSGTGNPVEFLGSTTGPKYTEEVCSPMQVTWSVRPQCAKIHIGSLSNWCDSNQFDEDHAHGVRELVTNPKLLSPIQ